MDGVYTGYIIRYDWSGQHVIAKSPLTLILNKDGNTINGIWAESGITETPVQAALTDSSLIFHNTTYRLSDHYSPNKAVTFEFRNASLQVINQKDSVYLAGNMQLWSVDRNEPEKPIYITLKKGDIPDKKAFALQDATADVLNLRDDSDGLLVYPNPFDKTLQLSFSLSEKSKVSISLYDMGGRAVHTETLQLAKGRHTHSITTDLPAGAYVLKLNYGKESKNTVVIKQ